MTTDYNQSQGVAINNILFNKLFPFHVLFDKSYSIISSGVSLLKVMPDIYQKDIRELFEVVLPKNIELNVDKIFDDYKNIDFYILKNKSSLLQMRVIFEYIPEDDIYAIIGIPWVTSAEELKDLKLDLSDFSSHDSMGDMLMALQLQKQTFSDLQEYGVMLDKKKTQLEEAVKLLDTSEKSLQTLLDSTCLGILMTDLNGNINIWNEGVQNITGIKIDDYDKKNLCDLFQLEGIYDNQNLISGQRYETKIINTNDKVNENIIKLTISPITDLNNSVKSYCHVFRDITNELKLESIMRENEKSMAVSLLTGQIAHQINDLLQGIHTNVDEAIDYIAADLVKDETGSIKTILKNIDEQSTLISKITNSMLSFSGQQYLSKKNYDINELIYNVIHQDDYQDIDKSIITLNLSHLPLIMEGDKKAFPTCLINILKNSSEALVNTKSPSIKIDTYVALEQELIDEDIKTSDYICIRIKDNGKGIKTDNLNLIFDPFYTTKIKTTQGMGLSFVQGYIRQIGGHLRVNSSYGLGTTVYFYIPLSTNINQNTFDL